MLYEVDRVLCAPMVCVSSELCLPLVARYSCARCSPCVAAFAGRRCYAPAKGCILRHLSTAEKW